MNKKELAVWLHNNYEEIAIGKGWNTQENCKADFESLPQKNKETMIEMGNRLVELINSAQKQQLEVDNVYLKQRISETKEECAKTADEITMNMKGYYDFIKENWDEFKGGQYSDREILSSFIAKAIKDKE